MESNGLGRLRQTHRKARRSLCKTITLGFLVRRLNGIKVHIEGLFLRKTLGSSCREPGESGVCLFVHAAYIKGNNVDGPLRPLHGILLLYHQHRHSQSKNDFMEEPNIGL